MTQTAMKTAAPSKKAPVLMALVPLTGQALQDLKDWLDLVLNYADTFRSDYCGYWAHGVRLDSPKKEGDAGYGSWLVYETGAEDRQPTTREELKAFTAAQKGKKLPKHWHLLDEQAATRAFLLGVEKWGLEWLQTGDASNHDVAIQSALLGCIVYG